MRRVFPRTPFDRTVGTVPMGQVFLIPERCKGCNFCIEFCPREVLVESVAMNAKGYHYPAVATGKDDECADCSFCALICPEFAIFTELRSAPAAIA
jgi:2-oxoglutarate ferredoxin oxidoreductase subunit delta